jgi:hypothetical protein
MDWTMPAELEPYRELITNTGGNTVERLMSIYLAGGEAGARMMQTNLPVYLMACMCGAQIALLRVLVREGKLPARGPAAGAR